MTAGLETPIAAGSGPSILGIAKAIGTKIRDSAEQAKEEKEKANKEGVEVKKGSLFTKSLRSNFNPLKSKKSKAKWAKDFSWNQPKPKDPAAETKGGGGTKGGGSGAKKLKNFITSAFGLLLKDTTVMVGKLSSISDLTGKVYSANRMMAGNLTSINSLLQEQTDIKRDMLEQAKYARMEKQMEKTADASGTSTPIGIGKKDGDGGEDGGGEDGGPGGGGGLFGGISSALDLADNVLDIGSHLKKTRLARKLRVAGKRGVRSAGKLAKNAKGFASKFLGKAAGKEGLKLGAKTAAKTGGKAVAKGIGKAVLKKIPLIGLIAGVGFGIERMMRGDWGGGLTEIASGAVSTVPGFGTAASVALDAGLMARDMSDPASMMPQEKLSEGGVIPSGVYDNPTTGVLPPGSSVIPLNRNVGKETLGQESTDEMLATPMKAVGAAILGITDRMLKNTDSGIAGDMIRQDISRLSRDFGISNPLTTSSLGKGSFGKKAFGKEGEKYFAEVMKRSFRDQGIDLEKKESPPPSSSNAPAAPPPSGQESEEPSGSPAPGPTGAAPGSVQPQMRSMTSDEVAAKNIQDTKITVVQGSREGSTKAVVASGQPGLVPVKDAELGGNTDYYHDTLGQVYKVNQETKKLTRVSQQEIAAGVHQDLGRGLLSGGKKKYFFRKPDKNVIISTLTSAPVNSIELGSREVVKMVSSRGSSVKALKPPTDDDRKRLGIDQINAPYGAPSTPVPQIKAERGVSVSSRRGWRIHPVTGGKKFHQGTDISAPSGTNLFAFTDGKVTDRRTDSGYGKQIHWTEKGTGIGHLYAHLSAFGKNTAPGTEFKKGKILGQVGSTGMSTGPHLHWEMGTNPEDTGRNGASLKDPLSKYSYMTPFTGKPQPGDGVDASDSSSPTDSENQQPTDTSQFANVEDIDSIFSKIQEYATSMSPAALAGSPPAPAGSPNSATNTKPIGSGQGGVTKPSGTAPRTGTTFVPVMPSQQPQRSGSVPGTQTPYGPPPVDVGSTPHAVNPFLFVD